MDTKQMWNVHMYLSIYDRYTSYVEYLQYTKFYKITVNIKLRTLSEIEVEIQWVIYILFAAYR